MKSRIEILVSIEINTPLKKLIEIVLKSGYSRIPIFEENLDNKVFYTLKISYLI